MSLPAAAVDEVVEAPVGRSAVRFRLRVYLPPATAGQAVVILEELPENPGPPVSEVAGELTSWVRRQFLPDGSAEPVWVEAWFGRALAALVRGRLPFSTFMRVDPGRVPPVRMPLTRGELQAMVSPAGAAGQGWPSTERCE